MHFRGTGPGQGYENRSQVQVRYLSAQGGQVVMGPAGTQMYLAPVSLQYPMGGLAPPSYLVQPMQVLRRHPQ